MNFRRIQTVFVKELVDILRDVRTLAAMIIVPLVLYPAIMIGGLQAVSTTTQAVEGERIIVGVEPREAWDAVVVPLLDAERRFLNQRAEAERDRVDDSTTASTGDAPPPVARRPVADQVFLSERSPGESLDDAVRQRHVHCGIVVQGAGWRTGNTADPVRIKLKYQPEDLRSEYAAGRLTEAFELVSDVQLDKRLRLLNIDRDFIEPIRIEREQLSTPGSVLGLILPLVLVLMTITGAIYPAIDLTAGERERGTLESLMACPVPVIELIVGKFLVVSTIAIVGAALNLASVTATVYFGGIEQALSGAASDGAQGFPIRALPVILLSLIPFAVFVSALMIAVCCCGRTFKEAQNYVTPLIIAVIVLGGIGSLPGARLAGVLVVMPVANMVLLTRELLSGVSVGPTVFAWVLTSTSLYAVAAVVMAAQVFGRESVVFADNVSFIALFRRRMFVPCDRPTVTAVGIYAVILFPVWFHIQGWLQLDAERDMGGVFRGTAVLMPILFGLIPMAFLIWRRVDLTATFQLRRPAGAALLGGILIGASAWVLAHSVLVWQSQWFGGVPADAEDAAKRAIASMPLWFVGLVLALVPALSEELFFRGFLLSGLRSSMRPTPAILIAAIAFGLFHFLAIRMVTTVALGLLFGWIAWRTWSIWPGVAAHICHNAILAILLVRPEWLRAIAPADDAAAAAHLPVQTTAGAMVMLGLGIILVARSRRREMPAPEAVRAGSTRRGSM
ncbi:MAG: CPBP family intramembrane metalloprotease [Phycisphaerales bacterium]|nr:CPBP family intramembrane metalloprotease [Phycisphaerales bacterium]